MVVIEGFVEVEGIGREVEKLVNKGGWVDGRGVGRGVGRWVRCGLNHGTFDGSMVGWVEIGKWKMVGKWKRCQEKILTGEWLARRWKRRYMSQLSSGQVEGFVEGKKLFE